MHVLHEADVYQAFKSKSLRKLAMRKQINEGVDASRLGWKH